MPTLRELQREFAGALRGSTAAALDIAEAMTPRLELYGNTRRGTLTQALGLTFPAVCALVGKPFFDALADEFAAIAPPRSAYLNDWGAQMPQFLRSYAPAASVDYLSDVAQLEWAVSRACHAPDAPRFDPQRLAEMDAADLGRVVFVGHPSVTVLRLKFPADRIWRSVLQHDEEGMRAIDLSTGPVYLLVERDPDEQVQVRRLGPQACHLTTRLLAGEPAFRALSSEPEGALSDDAGGESAETILAAHLSARRFIGCRLEVLQGELIL